MLFKPSIFNVIHLVINMFEDMWLNDILLQERVQHLPGLEHYWLLLLLIWTPWHTSSPSSSWVVVASLLASSPSSSPRPEVVNFQRLLRRLWILELRLITKTRTKKLKLWFLPGSWPDSFSFKAPHSNLFDASPERINVNVLSFIKVLLKVYNVFYIININNLEGK